MKHLKLVPLTLLLVFSLKMGFSSSVAPTELILLSILSITLLGMHYADSRHDVKTFKESIENLQKELQNVSKAHIEDMEVLSKRLDETRSAVGTLQIMNNSIASKGIGATLKR